MFEGDGICCWAGAGWYGLYEGKDIDDVSAQLFFGNGEVSKISSCVLLALPSSNSILSIQIIQFGLKRIHSFIAGKTPAPTTSKMPSETPSGVPSLVPSVSIKPSLTKYDVEITISLDKDSAQTGWNISLEDGTILIDRPTGYFSGNDSGSIVETVRLTAGEYLFTVLDTNGDGFCCARGVGFYQLFSNGQLLLFRQGSFEFSYTERFSIGDTTKTTKSALSSFNLATPLQGSVSYTPIRKRNHNHDT